MISNKAILLAALFVIISSKTVYGVTNLLTSTVGLPTQQYGAPTTFGVVLHAIVIAWLYSVSSKMIK
jgi:hypothetical protein